MKFSLDRWLRGVDHRDLEEVSWTILFLEQELYICKPLELGWLAYYRPAIYESEAFIVRNLGSYVRFM